VKRKVILNLVVILLFFMIFSCSEQSKEEKNIKLIPVKNIKLNSLEVLTDTAEGRFYHPTFSNYGQWIFFTSQNYKGIWYYSFPSRIVTQLSDANGIGYKFAIGKLDKKIYYRLKIRSGYKREVNYSLVEQDIDSKKITILLSSKERISPPVIIDKNTLLYFKKGKMHLIDLSTKTEKYGDETTNLILTLDNKLIKIKYGKITKINNPNPGNILFAVKSPVSEDIAFEVKGKGLFIKELNGKTIQIKNGLQPAWSPDGRMIVFVKEKSDGMTIMESKIFIAAVPLLKEFNLLANKNISASNPAWSPDGKKLVFNSDEGEIILASLDIQ